VESFHESWLGKPLVLREIELADVEHIVDYWHGTDPALLAPLGVDLSKLRSPEATRARFRAMVPAAQEADAPPCSSRAVVLCYGGKVVAYSNLNIKSPQDAILHFHVVANKGPRVKALAYLLFPRVLRLFFDETGLDRITLQTATVNRHVGRLLAAFGLRPKRVHLDVPDGLARPGEFDVYEISREESRRLVRKRRRRRGTLPQ
jgi:RimJ/RimL family protein N-acetyltransferase